MFDLPNPVIEVHVKAEDTSAIDGGIEDYDIDDDDNGEPYEDEAEKEFGLTLWFDCGGSSSAEDYWQTVIDDVSTISKSLYELASIGWDTDPRLFALRTLRGVKEVVAQQLKLLKEYRDGGKPHTAEAA